MSGRNSDSDSDEKGRLLGRSKADRADSKRSASSSVPHKKSRKKIRKATAKRSAPLKLRKESTEDLEEELELEGGDEEELEESHDKGFEAKAKEEQDSYAEQ